MRKTTYEDCIGCGLCSTGCPVFSLYMREDLTAKGRNLILQNIENIEFEKFREDIWLCTSCHFCTKICPIKIENNENIVLLRSKLVEHGIHNPQFDTMRDNIEKSGNIYGLKDDFLPPSGEGKTLLWLGCTMRHLFSSLLRSVSSFLERMGYEFVVLEDEPCCGEILEQTGYLEDAEKKFEKVKSIVQGYKRIITPCPYCYTSLNNISKNVGVKVIHISELVHKHRKHFKIDGDAYFQYPCHLYNVFPKFKPIFQEIEEYFGIDSSIDLFGHNICCGGTLFHDDRISETRIQPIVDSIKNNEIITFCPLCYRNFKVHSNKRVRFITDMFEESSS